ncbi:hypothetical protein DOTSEDRAFT_70314 [Dothistroma septosporum NZE10]|uniref:Uncharacterized protein n=1 Tax=Dothistroma septosporum (strain NZE10 / CBS 128990) TaxID=675120 RepID=N1PV93_DOTSN|nr:hypothetical protein DOTSEDRAFT_70314 [Dothistroma septosporum NZE10]
MKKQAQRSISETIWRFLEATASCDTGHKSYCMALLSAQVRFITETSGARINSIHQLTCSDCFESSLRYHMAEVSGFDSQREHVVTIKNWRRPSSRDRDKDKEQSCCALVQFPIALGCQDGGITGHMVALPE